MPTDHTDVRARRVVLHLELDLLAVIGQLTIWQAIVIVTVNVLSEFAVLKSRCQSVCYGALGLIFLLVVTTIVVCLIFLRHEIAVENVVGILLILIHLRSHLRCGKAHIVALFGMVLRPITFGLLILLA